MNATLDKSFEMGDWVRLDLDCLRANGSKVDPSCTQARGTIVGAIGSLRDREILWFVHWDGMVPGRYVKLHADCLIRTE